jgi:hypothetical protein
MRRKLQHRPWLRYVNRMLGRFCREAIESDFELRLLFLQVRNRGISDAACRRDDFPSSRRDAWFERQTGHNLFEDLFVPARRFQVGTDHHPVGAFLIRALKAARPESARPSGELQTNTGSWLLPLFLRRGSSDSSGDSRSLGFFNPREREGMKCEDLIAGSLLADIREPCCYPRFSGSWTLISIYFSGLRALDRRASALILYPPRVVKRNVSFIEGKTRLNDAHEEGDRSA